MKKCFLVCLAYVFLLSVIAGCSSSKTSNYMEDASIDSDLVIYDEEIVKPEEEIDENISDPDFESADHEEMDDDQIPDCENDEDNIFVEKPPLPLIKIDASEKIVDEYKVPATFLMISTDGSSTEKLPIGIEFRGRTAVSFDKKAFNIEFADDIQLLDMRNDDDWLLNAEYVDRTLMRNRVSLDIFKDIWSPVHSEKAHGAIDGRYVELVLNGRYNGLYFLGEKVDRKLLDLDESEGVIYKAVSHAGALSKTGHSGFEQVFPDNELWEPLDLFREFINESSDAEFKEKVSQFVDLDNAVDFYILMMITGACDNITKNYYLARNSSSSPFFFVPWDMDGSFGRSWNGEPLENFWPEGMNKLFTRLIATNGGNYKKKLKSRWNLLKISTLSVKSLTERFDSYDKMLSESGALERNFDLWPQIDGSYQDDLEYLKNWIVQRFEKVDEKISNY